MKMDNKSFSLPDELSPHKENGKYRRPVEGAQDNGVTYSENGTLHEVSDEKIDYMCGAFNRYPKCLQIFANPRCFLLAYCFENIVAGAEMAFTVGVTTSIEKHFQFSSGDIGLLVLLSEICPIITSVILSFMGGRGNRPRWLALGLVIGSIGIFLLFSTFLFHPAPTLSESGLLGDSKKFCHLQDVINFQFLNATTSSVDLASYAVEGEALQSCGGHSKNFVFFVWLMGFSFKALSGTIIFTIGAPYMDDSIPKNSAPVYFAISISVRVLGPAIGFALSALALNTYVYPGKNYGIKPNDPRWIGAWWIGPMVFSIILFLFSCILGLFPRKMGHTPGNSDAEGNQGKTGGDAEKSLHDEELVKTSVVPRDEALSYEISNRYLTRQRINGHIEEDSLNGQAKPTDSYGYNTPEQNAPQQDYKETTSVDTILSEKQKSSCRELLDALKRLSKNPVVTYGAVSDFFILVAVFGFFFWKAKYQEHQFRVTKAMATFFSGLSSTAPLVIGVLAGGFWIRRYRPRAKTVAYVNCGTTFLYMLSLIGMVFITCDFQDDLPGILSTDETSVELYRGCSSGCECDQKEFIPVCVRDGPISLTYFSPCHAGCPNSTGMINNIPTTSLQEDIPAAEVETFYNCTCGSPSAEVTMGHCQNTCPGFYTYNIVILVVKSFMSVGAIGGTLINMRCVAVQDKAIALGLKTTMMSAALIVNPIIFGSLVDSACLVWEETCQGRGSCWVYNTLDFGYKLHGIAAGIIFIGIFFSLLLARNIGDLQLMDDEPTSSSSSSSSNSSSSPSSSFFFSSGPGGGRKTSLRRSLKKISKLMGGDNGISRSPGKEKDGRGEHQTRRETEDEDNERERDRVENSVPVTYESQATQEPSFTSAVGNILPSAILKTTGV